MIASIKAGLDGVADVVGIDDSQWVLVIARGEPVAPGKVELTLEPLDDRP